MTTVFRVRNWDEHFEVWQSRRIAGPLSWVGMPTKHDGKSYRRLMRKTNGPALFCCWCLIVQVAAKCPARGTLADADGPLTAEDLEAKTGCRAEVFYEALEVLTSKEINWLETVEFAALNLPTVDHAQPTVPNRTEPNITEQNNNSAPVGNGGGKNFGLENGRKEIRFKPLNKLREVHLESVKILEGLRDALADTDPETFKRNDKCLLAILGAAERARELGKKPIAMFVSIVRGEQWDLITDQQMKRAQKRLDEHRMQP
ncbi:MAG: hypothetical protein KGO96_12690 [Elusimicrobia bacterium]|nr:hypothetical protein [Elusimicrobiota bacterium]